MDSHTVRFKNLIQYKTVSHCPDVFHMWLQVLSVGPFSDTKHSLPVGSCIPGQLLMQHFGFCLLVLLRSQKL